MDKAENPNEKNREEQEDFWLTPVSYTHLTLPTTSRV